MTEETPGSPVLLRRRRRRRDDHAEPSRRDEQPRRRHQGGAARRRHAAPPTTPPCAAWCSPAPAARSASARTSRSTSQILQSGVDATSCSRTVDEHYNPIVDGARDDAEAGDRRGQRRRRRRRRVSLAFACDLRILADTAGFNLAFAGVALSCDTGSSLDPPAAGRPGQGDRAALLPAHASRPPSPSSSGWPRRWCPPTSSAPRSRSSPAAWPPARPSRSARSAARSRTPPATASRTRWSSSRSMMTLTGATADHRAAVEAFVAKEKPVFEGR